MESKPGSDGRTVRGKMQEIPKDLARVATISIDTQVLPLHSWSMSGFRCGGYKGYLRPGLKAKVRIIIPSSDGPQFFELMAEIDQRDMATGLISGTFVGLSNSQVERMDAIFARRLSGRHRRS